MLQSVVRSHEGRERVLCPICKIDHAFPFIPFGPGDIVRCHQCGLIYVNPRRVQTDIEQFFQAQYIADESMLNQDLGAWRTDTLRREAAIVKELCKTGRILDIGCAGGEFLAHFVEEGWECYGVEPSSYAAVEAQRRGISVHQGTLRDTNLPEGYFDVITYLDTLYFVPKPETDLEMIHHLLRDDGLLLIELPGLPFRLLKNVGPMSLLINRRWCHLSSLSFHLYYFSTESLSRLLLQTGFKIDRIVLEQSPMYSPWFARSLNNAHFGLSKALFTLTSGRINLAAKVVYVCRKTQ
ncbi:MAG: class I SAM-dependent methyltransferase [Anaerolineae bacterium]|nr:class I SAM-dependent methyltransferase [Anaerolineae bacterium]